MRLNRSTCFPHLAFWNRETVYLVELESAKFVLPIQPFMEGGELMSLHHLMYLGLIVCLLYRVIVLAAGSIQLHTVSSTFLNTKLVKLDFSLSFGSVLIERFLATPLQIQGLTREL